MKLIERWSALLDRENVLSFLILAYLSLFLIPASTMAVLLLLNRGVIWYAGPICTLISFLVLWRLFLYRKLNAFEQLLIIIPGLLSVAVAGVVCIHFYDTSWDGLRYHSEAILSLLNGSNPIYGTFSGPQQLFTNHYPKATWYFAAMVAHNTGYFQLAKIYNFLFLYACGVYAWRFFRGFGLTRSLALLLALVTAANPVAITQMFSLYVDGALASLLTMLILASIKQLYSPTLLDREVLIVTATLLVAIKFTGVVYFSAISFLLVCAVLFVPNGVDPKLRFRRISNMFADAATVGVLGIVILGFNPYLTNVARGYHPLYPLAGPNKVDIISGNAPQQFLDPQHSRFEKFAVSLFSRTSNATGDESPILKVPFTIHRSEWRPLKGTDARIAAWGVLFSGALLFSIVAYISVRGWKYSAQASFAIVLVLVTTFINPYPWWARYTPQVALIPILLLFSCLLSPASLVKRLTPWICALLMANTMINAAAAFAKASIRTGELQEQISEVAKACGAGEYRLYLASGSTPIHYEVLSGYKGVILHPVTGELPQNSFKIGLKEYEAGIYREQCEAAK